MTIQNGTEATCFTTNITASKPYFHIKFPAAIPFSTGECEKIDDPLIYAESDCFSLVGDLIEIYREQFF